MEASIQGNSSMKEKLRFERVEFGGSLGDLGTLVPMVVAMILISKLSPSGVSPCLGLFFLLAGSSYRLPTHWCCTWRWSALSHAYPGQIAESVIGASGIIFGGILLILSTYVR